jgi:hypothetical protein
MEDEMRECDSLGDEFVKLALAVDEHLPGKEPVTPSQVRSGSTA